jgi:hypothetical protein
MNRYDILLGVEPPPREGRRWYTQEQPVGNLPKTRKKKTSTLQEQEGTIRQLIQTSEGRQNYADSLISSIRSRLDQRSMARRIFLVDPLFPGALPVYHKGTNTAYYIKADGESVRGDQTLPDVGAVGVDARRQVDQINVPGFPVTSNCIIPVRHMNSPVDTFARCQEHVCRELQEKEETCAFFLLDAVVSHTDLTKVDCCQHLIEAPLTMSTLMDAMTAIESNNLRVANIFMSSSDFATFRRLRGNHFDPETTRRNLATGLFGSVFGSQLFVSRSVSPGKIYLTAEPQTIGILPIIQGITITSSDDPSNRTINWLFSETIGMCCLNPSTVSVITTPAYVRS